MFPVIPAQAGIRQRYPDSGLCRSAARPRPGGPGRQLITPAATDAPDAGIAVPPPDCRGLRAGVRPARIHPPPLRPLQILKGYA